MVTVAAGRKAYGPGATSADDALSELFAEWVNNQELAQEGWKVLSGGLITPSATGGKLDIAAGYDDVDGIPAKVSAATAVNALSVSGVVPGAGRAWSVLEAAGGTLHLTPGEPAESPDTPIVPGQGTDGVIHGYLLTPAGATVIDTDLDTANGNAKLVDGRIINPLSLSGWRLEDPAANASYYSASLILLSGDKSKKYGPGTKLKWFESGVVKYAVVASSTYVSPYTHINIGITTDYVVGSAGPDDHLLLYSHIDPPDFPSRFVWLPSPTGFTSAPPNFAPNGSSGCWWSVQGKICTISVSSTPGTSTATTYTITNLPFPMGGAYPQVTYDNGAGISGTSTAGGKLMFVGAGSTVLNIYKDEVGNPWAATGNKNAQFTFSYPIG